MAISIPVTAAQIETEIKANLAAKTVSTPVSSKVGSDGITVVTSEELPDLSADAVAKATAAAVYTCLVAILNSTSINVSGVL